MWALIWYFLRSACPPCLTGAGPSTIAVDCCCCCCWRWRQRLDEKDLHWQRSGPLAVLPFALALTLALSCAFSRARARARKAKADAKAVDWRSHTYEHERPTAGGGGNEDTTNEGQFDRADGDGCLLLDFLLNSVLCCGV